MMGELPRNHMQGRRFEGKLAGEEGGDTPFLVRVQRMAQKSFELGAPKGGAPGLGGQFEGKIHGEKDQKFPIESEDRGK